MKNHPSIVIFLGFTLAVFAFPGLAKAEIVQELGQLAPSTAQDLLATDELNNLVAPIALYPDPLLIQIFVASTYPLEVVEAYQWLQRNSKLRGQELIDAAKQQPWDPSVQALVAVPDALAKLNQDIRWTTDLGNAFLAQQADVMKSVQRMRTRAQSNGRLSSTPQQIVTAEPQGKNQIVKIMPAEPDVIYVPVYDPVYVWGPPVYGFYPPLFYPSYGFGFGVACNLGLFFSNWDGWGLWGWGPNWISNVIVVNNHFFHRHGFYERPGSDFNGRPIWSHNPDHRLKVPYKNTQVAERFSGRASVPRASLAENRPAARTVDQGLRSAPPQSQSKQNPSRQQYQPSPQSQSQTRQYREAPQAQTLPSQTQRSNQSPQYRPAPQVSRSSEIFRAPQVYRAPQISRAPQVYRAPQISRAPQVQNRVQPSYRAPSQSRSTSPNGGSSTQRR